MWHDYYQRKDMLLTFAFFEIAVPFQPMVKIALERTMWNIVGVVAAIYLVVLTFKEHKDKPK